MVRHSCGQHRMRCRSSVMRMARIVLLTTGQTRSLSTVDSEGLSTPSLLCQPKPVRNHFPKSSWLHPTNEFVTHLIGRENALDVKALVAGIQHLIKEGIADPDRIGVMGWSNGGYLTNCLITMKDPPVKIRAASSGAGILDTVAEWGFN